MTGFYHTVGKNIRRLREANKLTQVEVAKELDVTFQQLQKYEKAINRLPLDKAYILARLFKSTIEEITGEK